MSRPGNRPPSAFRWLHAAWAVLGIAVIALLALAGGGHPPPIIFAPVVMAVWAAGHVALWVAGRLAARGGSRDRATVGPFAAAPRLIVATIACSAASLIGIIQVIATVMLREAYPFRGELWVVTMVIWLLHAACLAGILLRRGWAAPFAGALSIGWGALMGWQIVDHLWRGRPVDYGELALALAIVGVTGGYGVWLIRSRGAGHSAKRNAGPTAT